RGPQAHGVPALGEGHHVQPGAQPGRRDEVDVPQVATEDDHLGVEDVDQVSHTQPEPVTYLADCCPGHHVAAGGRVHHRPDRVPAGDPGTPGGTQQGRLPDLGLPAAARAAAAA